MGCQYDPNPCSLSQETLNDLKRLDSIIKLPETIERDKQWMMNNYKEPSIIDAKNETYRFLLSSSFDGTEIYRIEKNESEYVAIKKIFNDHSDKVGVLRELQFSEKDWIYLTEQLSSKGFWTYKRKIDRRGLDGSTWILSAYKPIKDKCSQKNFHSVSRWSPNDSTFKAMCDLFVELKEK